MTNEQKIHIPIEIVEKDFEEFLEISGNKRIFFSGKFGIGKTHFLKEYFAERKTKYNVCHLFPLRYQILPNENILNFLKYDILSEILMQNPKILEGKKLNKKENLYLIWKMTEWMAKSGIEIVEKSTGLTGIAAMLFRKVSEMPRKWKKLREILDKNRKEIKNFEKEMESKKYWYGEDAVSKFIQDTNKSNKKSSVLILDDLDRIDPEHIFRIINIISANMDDAEDNKFGFDYIIIVGNFDNIEKIYKNKYGEQIDFSGYIDKFISINPYYFENKENLIMWIKNYLIENIIKEKQNNKENTKLQKQIKRKKQITEMFLKIVLTDGIKEEKINVRTTLKPTIICFPEIQIKFEEFELKEEWEIMNKYFNKLIQFTIRLFGDREKFLTFLNKIIKKQNFNSSEKEKFEYGTLIKIMKNDRNNWLNIISIEYEKAHEWAQRAYHSLGIDQQQKLEEFLLTSKENFYYKLIDYIKNQKYLI